MTNKASEQMTEILSDLKAAELFDDQIKHNDSKVTDEELIEKSFTLISKLCETGGRSWTLSVPVNPNDPDVVFASVGTRLRHRNSQLQSLQSENQKLEDQLREAKDVLNELANVAANYGAFQFPDLDKLKNKIVKILSLQTPNTNNTEI